MKTFHYVMCIFQYLQDTLGEFVRNVIESTDSFEVDPAALVAGNTGSELQRRRKRLIENCLTALCIERYPSYC
jgi:hypothetical protein